MTAMNKMAFFEEALALASCISCSAAVYKAMPADQFDLKSAGKMNEPSLCLPDHIDLQKMHLLHGPDSFVCGEGVSAVSNQSTSLECPDIPARSFFAFHQYKASHRGFHHRGRRTACPVV